MLATSGPIPETPSSAVIDASVWVSTILSKDSNHLAALNWVNAHLQRGGSFVAPILLVTEVASAAARITRRPVRGQHAASRLYAMPQMHLVPIDQFVGMALVCFFVFFMARSHFRAYTLNVGWLYFQSCGVSPSSHEYPSTCGRVPNRATSRYSCATSVVSSSVNGPSAMSSSTM